MILGRGLVGFLLIALWVYCILDVIATDESRIRSLPKVVWLMIVIFLPDIGSLAWLLLGRPEGAGFAIGGNRPRRMGYAPPPDPYPNRFQAPTEQGPVLESREEALRRYYEEKQRRDAEIDRIERELLGKDEDPGFEPGADPGDEDGPR